MKTLDDLLKHLIDQSATEALTVADMLESIAGNDDEEMQTPKHLIVCLDELKGWAEYARKWLKTLPPDQPISRG